MKANTFIAVTTLLFTAFSCSNKSAEDYFSEASKSESQGDLIKAVFILNKAIQENPNYLPAYINAGADESMLGNYNAAIKRYTQVIALSPNNTLALLNRGKNESRIGNYWSSLEDFQRAVASKGGEETYIKWVPNKFMDVRPEYDCDM